MVTSINIPLETFIPARGKNFLDKAEENPCMGCSAPCCRMLLIPHPTPTTFMDLDYIRYMVGFPTVQMTLSSDGTWQVLIEQTCRLLDQKTNLCTVHNTPRKPKTCVFFNPHHCWYKRNFHNTESSPDLIRIDMETFEVILPRVQFDDEGNIVEIPAWEFIQELVNNRKSQHQVQPLLTTPVGSPRDGEMTSSENLDIPHRANRQDVDAESMELGTNLVPIADSVAD